MDAGTVTGGAVRFAMVPALVSSGTVTANVEVGAEGAEVAVPAGPKPAIAAKPTDCPGRAPCSVAPAVPAHPAAAIVSTARAHASDA